MAPCFSSMRNCIKFFFEPTRMVGLQLSSPRAGDLEPRLLPALGSEIFSDPLTRMSSSRASSRIGSSPSSDPGAASCPSRTSSASSTARGARRRRGRRRRRRRHRRRGNGWARACERGASTRGCAPRRASPRLGGSASARPSGVRSLKRRPREWTRGHSFLKTHNHVKIPRQSRVGPPDLGHLQFPFLKVYFEKVCHTREPREVGSGQDAHGELDAPRGTSCTGLRVPSDQGSVAPRERRCPRRVRTAERC